MSDPVDLMTALENAVNQAKKDRQEAGPKCEEGHILKHQSECEQCYGEDPYGDPWFCPECGDYCCGC